MNPVSRTLIVPPPSGMPAGQTLPRRPERGTPPLHGTIPATGPRSGSGPGPSYALRPGLAEHDVIVPPAGTVPAGTDVVSGTHAAEIGELTARMRLIEKLGISTEPTAFFDAVATELATRTAFLYGFVNLVLTEQTFVGLHNPPAGSGHLTVRRTMGLDHGWCPEVVKRKKALPLADVHQSPRFTGNPVVDAVGIRSYFGAPLLHKPTGIVLGTVCVIDPEPRPQTDAVQLRDMVNEAADTVMAAVTGRATAR